MKYTFGTGNEAASRLEEISKFFNPLASALLTQYIKNSPAIAVDIGCGPGFTTDMLYHALKPREIYGLDNSPVFLAMAKSRFPHCRFIEHDITVAPFPVMGNVMYARFILSHLPKPVKVIKNWVTQLKAGGIIVIEEVEAIETEIEVFKLYLSTNEALVATQGAHLFVGQELAGKNYDAEILLDDCAILPVADNLAATWFLPNTTTTWRQSEFVQNRLSPPEIENISNALFKLANSGDKASHTVWKMRRIVLRK